MNKKIFTGMTMRLVGAYTRDINASFHGRELARRLKANQRTVQLHLNALEKEKVFTSAMKGKTKEFSLNQRNPLALQVLLMAEVYKSYRLLSSNFEIYQIVSDVLGASSGVVVVYGSFAKGYAAKGSDLDILVIGKLDKKKRHDIQERYSREIHIMVMGEKEFVKGLRNKANFMLELMENHIICRGFERFLDWVYEYG